MKIATWNVERLKHKLDEIIYSCEQTKADILVLTETDQRIELNYRNCFHTSMVSEIQPKNYKNTENRVSIYTNYKCVHQYATFDKYTAICIELETAMDFKRLSQNANSLCICGDYNCSFEDNYYYTRLYNFINDNPVAESAVLGH